MKKLLIVLLWLNPILAMDAEEIQELVNANISSPGDLLRTLVSSDEIAKIYQNFADSPPLSADPLWENVTAAEMPTFLIHLQRATELPVPAALETPLTPLIEQYKRRTAYIRQYCICKIKTCLNRYDTMDELLLHYSQAHPDVETFNCDVCQEPYIKIDSLRRHRARKHNLLAFKAKNFSKQVSQNK